MTTTDIDGPDAARNASLGEGKTASLYRMAMPGHLCPFGLKSKALLEWKGYRVDDNLLTTREEVDAFRDAHGVKTTPQTWIDGERVGGFTDLKARFGYRVLGKDDTTYAPVIAIFGSMALLAAAIVINLYDGFPILVWLMWFFATSMVALAVQKLQDVGGFVSGFLGYDLLAQRYVPYGYAYPFLELFAGIGMAALIGTGSALIWLVAPVSLFIGTIGAVSVIKAVYVEKRDLKCACVGGGSNVPLGFISLTENLVMVAMGLWMIVNVLTGTTMPL
ncbi:glutaredoxin [Palleronia aestuarii]|uniref:Methylamine utilization protein MauE n=1 Tax=Palleronia aestuarii TaxID=568105 RepID=A0A2W7Q4H9_9RHOB|nr:MauE/DoxX family redox-associated membrane protein [Palleronia aestuarii]PZX16589.1 glutaredoxin [Palleronia aestuarii]